LTLQASDSSKSAELIQLAAFFVAAKNQGAENFSAPGA